MAVLKELLYLVGTQHLQLRANLAFAEALQSIPRSIHLSYYNDETSTVCKWHVNQAHWLEVWNDGRSADGTTCIGQPLIEPLFGGVSSSELLAIISGFDVTDSHTLVRTTFNPKADQWNPAWRTAVHDGVVSNTSTLETPPVNRKLPPARELKVVLRPYSLHHLVQSGMVDLQTTDGCKNYPTH